MATHKNKSDFLYFKNVKEKDEFRADIIQSNIMDTISRIMEKAGVNKTYLAQKMGVSNSFISQLFTIDKRLNFTHLSQLERIFNCRIRVSFDNVEQRVVYNNSLNRNPQYGTSTNYQLFTNKRLNHYSIKTSNPKKHQIA